MKVKLKEQHYYLLIFAFLAATVLAPLSPLAFNQYAPPNDFPIHFTAISQASLNVFKQFPLRIMPNIFDNYLYPNFQFYSPASYTILGIVNYFVQSPLHTYVIVCWSMLIVGAWFIYKLTYYLIENKYAALISGAAFIYTPALMFDMLQSGLLNEAIARLFIPICLFVYFKCICEDFRLTRFLMLAVLGAILLLTHIISFFLISLSLSLLTILLYLSKEITSKQFLGFLGAGILMLVLNAYYILPILGGYTDIQQAGFRYSGLWRTSLSALISLSPIYNYGSYTYATAIGWPVLLAMLFSIKSFDVNNKFKVLKPYLLVILTLCFLLMIAPSSIWSGLPAILYSIQFAFRFMSIFAPIAAIFVGACVYYYFRQHLSYKTCFIIIILIVLFNKAWLALPPLNTQYEIYKYIETNEPYQSPRNRPGSFQEIKNLTTFFTADYMIDFHKYVQFETSQPIIKIDSIPTFFQDIFSIKPNNASNNIHIHGKIARYLTSANVVAFDDDKPIFICPINNNGVFSCTYIIVLQPHKNNTIRFSIKDDKGQLSNPGKYVVFSAGLEIKGNNEKIIPVNDMEPYCKQTDSLTKQCNINVDDKNTYLQLPILYYPNLLDVSINGKKTSYFATTGGQYKLPKNKIPYFKKSENHYLLTTIKAQKGQNKITVSFKGNTLGNWISTISWILTLLLLGSFWFFGYKKR